MERIVSIQRQARISPHPQVFWEIFEGERRQIGRGFSTTFVQVSSNEFDTAVPAKMEAEKRYGLGGDWEQFLDDNDMIRTWEQEYWPVEDEADTDDNKLCDDDIPANRMVELIEEALEAHVPMPSNALDRAEV